MTVLVGAVGVVGMTEYCFFLTTIHDHETSMRPLVHTTGQPLWTDVGLSTTGLSGAATSQFVPQSAAASTLNDVLVHAADPTLLVATVREPIREKTNNELTTQGD